MLSGINHIAAQPDKLPTSTRGILAVLDDLIEKRKGLESVRRAKSDSIRDIIQEKPDRATLIDCYFNLGEIESKLSVDSSIMAYNNGLALCDESTDSTIIQRFHIFRALQYFNSGAIHEALVMLEHVEDKGVYDENLLMFHDTYRRILFTMATFYEYDAIEDIHMKRAVEHARQEMELLDPESPRYLLCQALVYLGENKKQLMAASLHDSANANEAKDGDHTEALAQLGEYYWDTNNLDEAVYNYALSAIYNLLNAQIDGTSLLRLGELLYSKGDTSRAHKYLAVAMDKAIQAGENFNLMRINEAYMEVTKLNEKESQSQLIAMSSFLFVLILLLGILLKTVRDKRREVRRLHQAEQSLAKANMVKETYITEFMNLCSGYIESLEEYNKMCRRKITANQTDGLLNYIKSGKVVEEQRKKFYGVFDEALLHIFPKFVSEVNSLLQPDKQITPPSPNTLTTELRIIALSRLGIEDATIISRFLGVSTNTIYTYRNKLRTRAIDRVSFEEEIKKICSL